MPSAMVLLACDSSVVWLTLTAPCDINSSSSSHDPQLSVCKGKGHISKQYLHALKHEHSKLEKRMISE